MRAQLYGHSRRPIRKCQRRNIRSQAGNAWARQQQLSYNLFIDERSFEVFDAGVITSDSGCTIQMANPQDY